MFIVSLRIYYYFYYIIQISLRINCQRKYKLILWIPETAFHSFQKCDKYYIIF